jgi:hypothetical protein
MLERMADEGETLMQDVPLYASLCDAETALQAA